MPQITGKLITIFQNMGDELRKKINVNTNDIETVKLAMGIEEKGIKFYEQAAKESQDKKESETYRFLAGEEKDAFQHIKEHPRIFRKHRTVGGRE